jgi:DNA-binding transcriptional MerR regulator
MISLKTPNPPTYSIGQAAQTSGVSAANIRFYEKEGLMPARGTGANGYRFYNQEDIHQLRFIRRLRSLDMGLAEMRTLLGLNLQRKADCQTARDTIDAHLGYVKARLKELRALEKDLTGLRNQCHGDTDHCHLIEALHTSADSRA